MRTTARKRAPKGSTGRVRKDRNETKAMPSKGHGIERLEHTFEKIVVLILVASHDSVRASIADLGAN